MNDDTAHGGVEVELGCADLGAALERLGRIGFRVETISPADDPRTAIVSGHGVRLRLTRGAPPVALRVGRAILDAPSDAGGIPIVLAPAEAPPLLAAPPRSLLVTRNDPGRWHVGRAGMHYRDLVPDRRGGRVVASHIRVPEGGAVADWVHFHEVRFQMIYCVRGWVRLVYEDQGEPFVMHAGDCVLQPPRIRHRVLACSPGLEVVEIASPADHPTHADHALSLPNGGRRRDRTFAGQRFVWHRAGSGAVEAGSLGLEGPTGGIAAARVLGAGTGARFRDDAELLFGFVVDGAMTLRWDEEVERLAVGDAFVAPKGQPFALADGTPDLAWLEVRLTAAATAPHAPSG